MLDEARQAPAAVARLMGADEPLYAQWGSHWRRRVPPAVVTLARGSSDHAAHYFAYLAMARVGCLVTSLPPSLITLHRAPMQGRGVLAVAYSQSGRSPDLIQALRCLGRAGAQTYAVVNNAASPLARVAGTVLPLHAEAETSVAATKSFIAQLVVGARLVAAARRDTPTQRALLALPAVLARALEVDPSLALPPLLDAQRMFVVGRGVGMAITMEAALKLKELCGIQAEAISAAELRHGPLALIGPGYPVLMFAPRGASQRGVLELAADLRTRGAQVVMLAPQGTPGAQIEVPKAGMSDLDPVVIIQVFYCLVEALARARGLDPDAPRHLSKVTLTR